MIGVGIGVTRAPSPRPAWHPRDDLGEDLVFFGWAEPSALSLVGSTVNGWTNDGGTGTSLVKTTGGEATYDGSDLLNGVGAVSTANDATSLLGTGGPTGSEPWHMIAFAKTISPGSSGNNSSTFCNVGPAGDATASGIGSTPTGRVWAGGYDQPTATASEVLVPADARLMELINTGTGLIYAENLRTILTASGVTSLASTVYGVGGAYPLPAFYGAVDARIRALLIAKGNLTAATRNKVAALVKSKLGITPRRLIVGIGDSTMLGVNPLAGTDHGWIDEMATIYAGAGTPVDHINAGISGQTTAEIRDRVDAAFLDELGPLGANYCLVDMFIVGGYNDTTGGLDAAAAHANLVTISNRVKARSPHFRTWIGTSFGGVGVSAGAAQYFVDLNNLIVNGAAAGGYGALDWRGLVENPITTFSLPDTVHQSPALVTAQANYNITRIG